MTWNDQFLTLFDRCVAAYQGGDKDFENYYSEVDLSFLASIGYQPREFFDFVEDYCEYGVPSISTALLVAAARRDFFLTVQHGVPSTNRVTADDVPAKTAEFHGIPYFARIIPKAKAKLRGELDPDLMFGCGGDRRFLANNGDIPLADFLRNVWACGDDDEKLATWVKDQIKA
ncbi:hypothetical protein JIN85_16470 [Luteolibacter pohnpeiensis]|uniref:DUF5069 domain-containing protein n=1 Tax=Luteolibacter pohnpeiensis TaxID=454153 RepID=A0A934VS83_9BACT|nr:hypothetical protein [Luteolibacter pohnpeiensis]MBK1884016.1 hypothetical protein [Luteolibacter pohnpeiensis]